MFQRPLWIVVTLAVALVVDAQAFAAEQRHEFLEPIHPDRRQQEKAETAPSSGKVCYCRTVHERNAAGSVSWKMICSRQQPGSGARKIYADDCSDIHNVPDQ
jgi:hypothetical protein